ncbi:MAG TPA: hypothetical protein VMM55_13575 [Thermohalobaculum sp.]|nr:hypothetical protein [Thermohalobaculum sp.]
MAAAAKGSDGAIRRIAAAVAAAWRRREHEAAMREAERCLGRAPDAILSDIGIRPDDIGAAVRRGREHFGWR